MPLISVIIPTFNRAGMLEEALASVFGQTFRDFEVIVVDDGSTDRTRRVIEKYTIKIRPVSQANRGQAAARNAGIGIARGQYLAFLDDDDLWEPHKLELQANVLRQRADVDVVHGPLLMFDGLRNRIWDGDASVSEPLLERLLSGRCVSTPSGILLRKAVVDRVGLFDGSLCPCEDWEFLIRIALGGGRFCWIDEPLTRYRLHTNTASSEVDRVNAARVAVLRKVFDAPETPRHLKAMKRYYVSRLWLRIGSDRYVRSQLGGARAAWWNAIQTDCSVLTPRLLTLMARTVFGPHALGWGRRVRHAVANVKPQRLHEGS